MKREIMKHFTVELKLHNGLITLFIVGGFFLLALASYISTPNSTHLQTQSWTNIDDRTVPNVNIAAVNTTSTKPSNYPEEHSTTNEPPGVDKQLPEESHNSTATITNTGGKNTTYSNMELEDVTKKIQQDVLKPPPTSSNTEVSIEKIQELTKTTPICDFSDPRSNLCNMTGDVRIDGNITTVYFVPPPNTFFPDKQEWNFSPQSRRIIRTKNVTVKHLHSSQDAPICTVMSNVPAMVFSLGGLVGNIWHDFSDVLIPLFLASKPLNGQVQFLIRDYYPWFVEKYARMLTDLSHYDIVNLDNDKEVRCYGHATVGFLNHGDLGIHPDRAFDRFDLFRFRMYMREIYSLPPFWVDIPYKMDPRPDKKPRLMLVLRAGSRKFLNEEEVKEVVKKNGFELVTVEPKKNVNLTEFSKLVDSCDVLMGVHGAALTNFFFLRTNAIMLQIIPYGHIDNFAFWYYGSQALDMKLRKIDYTIIPEESSLLEKYGWDHPVIKDPDSVNAKGYVDRMKYYWYEQSVRLNVTRFEPVLVKALQLLKE